jgi:class 3 adenylate cyclase
MTSPNDQGNRTFIGSVVFVDIVGYSRKSVSEQITMKDRFTTLLADSLKDIAAEQRIVLDTGDGAAISFIGDPEDALFVSMNMRDSLKAQFEAAVDQSDNALTVTEQLLLRIGINLGPIKLVRDINSQPNIVGDGINVAQRIMSFGRPGQIVCSRSYFDVVSVISEEYEKLFKYEGSRTDKHVREHEIYVVGESAAAFNKAKAGMEDRAAATNPRGRAARGVARTASAEENVPFFQSGKKLAIAGVVLATAVGALALAINWQRKQAAPADTTALARPSATSPVGATAAPKTDGPSDGATKDLLKDVAKDGSKDGAGEANKDVPKFDGSADPAKPEAPKVDAAPGNTPPATSPAASAAPKAAPKADPAKAAANLATVNFAIQPWGEVFVNGRAIGVTPPVRQHRLPPGKYRIEIRNSTFTPYISNIDLKAREEIAIRHKFQ